MNNTAGGVNPQVIAAVHVCRGCVFVCACVYVCLQQHLRYFKVSVVCHSYLKRYCAADGDFPLLNEVADVEVALDGERRERDNSPNATQSWPVWCGRGADVALA